MENSRLGTKILTEIEKLIDNSLDASGAPLDNFEEFHKALLKNHYKAACATIDYHRHRVKMDIIINEEDYQPQKINMILATVPMNIFFKDLADFLKSCLDSDVKNLAFYARLIRFYTNRDIALLAV
ncbi:hypothetical protein [Croceivirga thetidis]|uniref:Uncharacterized protein n=1 Tax=Croceivirga thetidis TaxID=2721623 RepID=A0ABX1GPL0_9FLAO|nr:hypothetical protein [Croceivirga thetidis]NKI30885.1 hypothetical protein [Croceivirga thetidis]